MAELLRIILGTLAVIALVLGAACAPAAAPSPTAASAKPTSTAAPAVKPAATTASAVETPRRGVSTTDAADWKADWDKTVAAAKKEGKVAVDGPPGDLYRLTAAAFQKAYPEIQVEYTGMDGPDIAPRMQAEREGGQYLWDVYVGGATTAFSVFRPKGVLDPLKPVLILPEVIDDSKWIGGFDSTFMDTEGKYIFAFEAGLQYSIYVNRSMVPESELNTHDQLLDPKWKGKIVSGDLRTAGAQNGSASQLLKAKGDDWLRKFYAQDIAIIKDERAVIESVVRGRYPIMVGPKPAALQQFRQEGLADNIKPLDPGGPAGAALSSSSSHATLINKAPHPNAAKVFLNWLLSKEGQSTFIQVSNLVSRRLDVEPGDAFFKPKPSIKYLEHNREDFLPFKTKAQDIAKEVIK